MTRGPGSLQTPADHAGTARPRARLADVAQAAGVTKSTASRVLNNSPGLSIRQETRQRVVEAAALLGYHPHAGARALAAAQARSLALLLPDLANPTYARIVRGAFRRAQDLGYVLLIAEDDGSDPSDRAFTDLVGAGRVDGLMVASAREGSSIASQLRATGVPHVFVNRSSAGSGRNVTMDVAAASTAAVSHLAELGHSRIGHIAGPRGVTSARERESGFRAAARRQAVARSPVCRGAFSEAGGYEATGVIVRRHPDLTALYASTLPQAIGALHALRHLGRSVPDDISVVSFDDLPLAEYLDPPLTCISMPLVELGTMAVNALIGQLEGAAPCDVVVPTHPVMVVRSSSGPPRP